MPVRDSRLDRAHANADSIVAEAVREFQTSRRALGLSMREAGAAVGMSTSQVSRICAGRTIEVTVEQLCRLHSAVGLRSVMRAYPDGDPVRDIAQVRLLERLRVRTSQDLRWRTEVPVHGSTDARAWDAMVEGHDCREGIEAVSRFGDAQMILRRLMRKLRDDTRVGHVVLLLADTHANRRALEEVRASLVADLPLDTRAILRALGRGECPRGSGIVIL
jgi:transcriptional regulator with XRE-family HTH domain